MKVTNNNQIKERVFLVGCPRSGTTLLQSLLAAHSQIASFPESFFFNYLIPSRPWLYNLGIASRWVKPQLVKFLAQCGHLEMKRNLPKVGIFMNQYVNSFIEILDTLTEEQNKNIWIEKTPWHLHYIDYIENFMPNAKFIHIIRNGQDVVASLYEVTNKYPESWRGAKNIDRCIDMWSKAVAASKKHLSKPNHILVRYEHLLSNPENTLAYICEFLKINFEAAIIENRLTSSQTIILESEPWKKSVNQSLKKVNNYKFLQLFEESQQNYIMHKIASIDIMTQNGQKHEVSIL